MKILQNHQELLSIPFYHQVNPGIVFRKSIILSIIWGVHPTSQQRN